ncbi:unnamed protein product [Aphanomyces euteiches]|uniref:FAD-binding PCMH-type domain-containing protein n=1 Tax=Aphanomyces euteiches TaxID=100861 RepID=A0A6G0WHG5_9STRA|nr:hypothetical protein Ae201684_015222 [Aphanomyces euteiches]KAH9080000.1 hypothetical protein Ae201684P_020580 [Aphanomyces euteiches]
MLAVKNLVRHAVRRHVAAFSTSSTHFASMRTHVTSNSSNPIVFALAGVGLAATGGAIAFADAKQDNLDTQAEFINWSATHGCRPVRVYEPKSVDEIESIVAQHHREKSKLRCMGSGVSPNGLGFSNESILTLAHLDRIVNVDVASKQVTVQGGVLVGDLLTHLRKYGLTLQNVASIREQTIAGVTQAGCHGTGAAIPPMEEQILSMEIVTPAEGRLTLNDPSDPCFQLAKCGLGALGVVTQLTLQCVPMHHLVEHTQVMTIEQLHAVHESLLKSHQHLRYMWLPHTDKVVVVTCDQIDPALASEVTPTISDDVNHRLRPLRQLYFDLTKTPAPTTWRFTQLRDSLYALDPLNAAHIARVTQVEVDYWLRSQGKRVALSDDVIGFDCGGQQLVSEVALPIDQSLVDIDFMQVLLDRISADRIPAHTPIEQRWTASSRASLSPAHGDPKDVFSWVGIIYYLQEDSAARAAIESAFVDYSKTLEDIMAPFHATEHWAKLELGSRTPDKVEAVKARLAKRFPQWSAFKALRDTWDPHHILSNKFVDQVASD